MRRPSAGVLLAAFALIGVAFAADDVKLPGPALAIERELARVGAGGVVLLGNSKVDTDVDHARLRAALGADAPPVVGANVFGTSAPVWYAVLKNRVYATGHRPRLLVVFAPLETALTTDLPVEAARAVLAAQLGADEPVVAAKVFGGVLDDAVKDRLRRLLLPACHPDRAPRERVPPPAATNADLAPDRSFLADILALARDHGTPVLVVRAPFAPSRAAQDDVPAATVAAAVALVESFGGRWVDLSRGAPEAAFGDGVHMNAAGRTRMTDLLAAAVRSALANTPMPASPSARTPAFELDLFSGESAWSAAPPALPAFPTLTPFGDNGASRGALPPGLPSEEMTFAQAGHGRCVPLQVLRDGAPVAGLDATAGSQGVVFTPQDCNGVDSTGLSWQIDPARTCKGGDGRWILPGEALTLSVQADTPGVPLRLDIGGGVVGAGAGALEIEVRREGKRVGRAEVPLASFASSLPHVPLGKRAWSAGGRVDVTLRNTDPSGWLLLTSARLVDSSASGFHDWMVPP